MPQEAFGHTLLGSWRVVFVVICGVGLVGGEVQHMEGQTQRIWERSSLHRMEMFYCWKKHLRSKNTDWRCVRDTVEVRGHSEITLTYVSGSCRHGSPPLSDKLVGVKTNLNDVVEQSQERSQRERCYEYGSEAKLEDCRGKKRLDELQRMSVSALAHTALTTIFIQLPSSDNMEHFKRVSCFTHFKVFVHQSMGVHRLQIPVFVPLWKLGFIVYILPCTTSFLHLPARPPVLQQTGNVASS